MVSGMHGARMGIFSPLWRASLAATSSPPQQAWTPIQWLSASCQLPAVSRQLGATSSPPQQAWKRIQWLSASCQLPAVSSQLPAVSCQLSARALSTLAASPATATGSKWPSYRLAPNGLLPKAAVQGYRADGAIHVRGMVDPDWVDKLWVCVQNNMRQPGPFVDEHIRPGHSGRFHDDEFLWRRHEDMKKFVFESRLSAIARQAMGSATSRLLMDSIFVKEPDTDAFTPWHNDGSGLPTRGQVISFWLALECLPESACLKFVRGSHKWRAFHRSTAFNAENPHRYGDQSHLPPAPNIEKYRDQLDILAWEMQPGDCLLFDSMTMHGGGSTTGTHHMRTGYVTRWMADDCTWDTRPGTILSFWRERGFDPPLANGEEIVHEMFPAIMTP